MLYSSKETPLVHSSKRLKHFLSSVLIFGLCFSLALPSRQAAAQGDCNVECSATVPAAAAVNTPVSFASTATASACASAASVDWDFGDGTARATQANTTHTYAAPGAYTWQMTASANSSVTTIDTVAGGYGEGAPVRQAPFTTPTSIARDPLGRGLFVVDVSSSGSAVRFINTTADTVTMVGKKIEPGTGRTLTANTIYPSVTSPLPFNVKASDVFISPVAVAVSKDGGLLYIGDHDNSTVWVYNISGSERTVFGDKLDSGNVGELAFVVGASAVAVHPTTDDVYVASSLTGINRIFRITGFQQIQAVAGSGGATNGAQQFPVPPAGQQLDATAVPLFGPRDIEFDSAGNLYIADSGHARVVRVDAAGKITLVYQFAYSGAGQVNPYPSALSVRGSEVYVAAGNQQTIVRIAPTVAVLAGEENQSCDYSTSNCGDGGPAASAKFNLQNSSNTPPLVGLEADANGLFILDQANSLRGRIRYFNLVSNEVLVLGKPISAGAINTVSGNGAAEPYDNGLAISSVLSNPTGVAVDANGNLFIADTPRSVIRFVNRGKSVVTLFAGTLAEQVVPPGVIVTLNKDVGAGATENVPVNQAGFDNPQGLFATKDGILVVDTKGGPVSDLKRTGFIRFINTSASVVTFFGGSGRAISIAPGRIGTIAGGRIDPQGNGDGSFATEAKFLAPSDVVVHPTLNHIYIADVANKSVRKINGSTGLVSSLMLPAAQYAGLGIDASGRLYIADFDNGQVLRESADDSGQFAKLNAIAINRPRDVAIDQTGNAYVVTGSNELEISREARVMRVKADGTVETVAGTTPGFGGDGGPAANAQLATLAGTITVGALTLGPAYPRTANIAIGPGGEIVFTDTANDRIRRISTGVTTCVKSGTIIVSGNYPGPTLSKLTPAFAQIGRALTLQITGTGFTPSTQVRWKGEPRATTFISSTQLLAAITAGDTASRGSADVTVFNPTPGGGSSNPVTIQISGINAIPGANNLSPARAAIGTAFTLAVTGSNFVNGSTVHWNGAPRTTRFVSSFTLEAQIPASDLASAGNALVMVVTPEPGGGVSSPLTFTITAANAAPTLAGIQPSVAIAGTGQIQLNATGQNFAVNSVVRWNGMDRPTTFVNSASLLATIPASDLAAPSTAAVTVFTPTPGGGATSAASFFVGKQATTVPATVFSGNTVAPDSIVSIFGVDLATGVDVGATVPLPTNLSGTTVTVRDNAKEQLAPLFFVSPGQINCLIPASTNSGQVTIIVKSGDKVVGVSTVSIDAITPGLFTANSTGKGIVAGVALRVSAGGSPSFEPLSLLQGGQPVAVPLELGAETDQVYLVIFGSGIRGRNALTEVLANVGGVSVPVTFAGPAPGLIGVDQVNLGPLPRNLAARGAVNIVLSVNGRAANTVTVTMK